MKNYDLIVLGTGGAGYQVASDMAAFGWNVAAIDKGPFGGTCSNRGCIPKKVLAHAAEIADGVAHLRSLGIVAAEVNYNWPKLMDYKRTFTDSVSDNTIASLTKAGVSVYVGSPRFVGEDTLEVNGERLQADKIHIATGAIPRPLNFPGAEHILSSNDFLELATLPESFIFVGGGYIGFEFAHIVARFGAKVTILESSNTPLSVFDADMITALVKTTRELGIEIITGAKVDTVAKTADGYEVSVGAKTYQAAAVIHAAGRVPNVAELNLEAAGVDYDPHYGIKVNSHLRSESNPNITAAGDVAATGPPLTPIAGLEGAIVTKNLQGGNEITPDYNAVVSVIFTTPRAGSVGISAAAAAKSNIEVVEKSSDYSGWFDAKKSGYSNAFYKTLVEPDTGKILGASVIGPHAEEVLNMFALAIANGLNVAQVKLPQYAFPTSIDDARYMI